VVDLPRIGTPMFLSHTDGVSYRSRLEEADGAKLSLAAPLETTGDDLPRPGHRLDVYWALPRTRVILPCRLVEIGEDAPYRWVLEAVGQPKQSNRRRYVRGGGGGAVRLMAEADEEQDQEQVVGRLLDISEGGLRCWVPRSPGIGQGDPMQASVPLGKADLDISASVLSVREAWDEPGQHMILTFDTSEREARLIRQHVFSWEIAERRRYDG
jgi:hypothetical protein